VLQIEVGERVGSLHEALFLVLRIRSTQSPGLLDNEGGEAGVLSAACQGIGVTAGSRWGKKGGSFEAGSNKLANLWSGPVSAAGETSLHRCVALLGRERKRVRDLPGERDGLVDGRGLRNE
jgi:hypothetical protein